MSAQWKPGDVARHPQGFVGIFVSETSRGLSTGCTVSAHEGEGDHWHYAYGGWDLRDSAMSRHARRLVVIDAEDAEQVERLARAYFAEFWSRPLADDGVTTKGGDHFPEAIHIDSLSAALREFARPTPPRCVAHGVIECDSCARISAEYLRDGQCTDCGSWGETGMHYDTCPGRIRGAVYANRDEARGVRS